MHARLLRPNITGHIARPQIGRLPDAGHLFAVRFAHQEVDAMTEPTEIGVHLGDGQRHGARYRDACVKII